MIDEGKYHNWEYLALVLFAICACGCAVQSICGESGAQFLRFVIAV